MKIFNWSIITLGICLIATALIAFQNKTILFWTFEIAGIVAAVAGMFGVTYLRGKEVMPRK